MSAGHRAALSAILIVLAIAPVAALANGGHHHHHGHADRAAHHSLRAGGHRPELLLRHGRPLRQRRRGERQRRPAARQGRGPVRLRPDRQGLVPRRRPQGPDRQARLHQGPRHDRDLAHAELQEQGRPAQQRFPSAGYHGYWITDFTQIDPHLGTNEDLRDARRRRPRARHQGLLRHHRQPHGRRHQVPGGRGARRTPRRTSTPYKTAAGSRFDDRDYAGSEHVPAAGADRPAVCRPPAR